MALDITKHITLLVGTVWAEIYLLPTLFIWRVPESVGLGFDITLAFGPWYITLVYWGKEKGGVPY